MGDLEMIEKARATFAGWREEATAGRWIVDLDRGESFGSVDTPDVYSESNADSVVLPAGTVAEHDIPLIVGTAGRPELLDAIDGLLADVEADPYGCGYRMVNRARSIAAAIVAAEEAMQS